MDNPLLDSAVRRRFVDELSAEPGRALTAAQLAEIGGVHTSTARFHLDQLVAAQVLATSYERRGVGRPRKVYSMPGTTMETSIERHNQSLQLLSGLLVDMLGSKDGAPARTPEQAGEEWARDHLQTDASTTPSRTPGEWLSKIGGLTDVLHEWGYTPQISTGADRESADVRLSHCPFRDLAKANPTVVCGIHRGLMRGAMAKLGETDTDVELRPFQEGETCIAHLHRGSAAEHRTNGAAPHAPSPARRGGGMKKIASTEAKGVTP